MTDPKQRVRQVLGEALLSIRGEMSSQGINASGLTASGFRVVEEGDHIRLVYDGRGAPLTTLEEGRKPGKVPFGFVEIIEQWSRDKGLSFPSDKDRRKFAGAVAFGKIRERGFGRPSPSDYGSMSETVYTAAIEKARAAIMRELPGLLAYYYRNQFKST